MLCTPSAVTSRQFAFERVAASGVRVVERAETKDKEDKDTCCDFEVNSTIGVALLSPRELTYSLEELGSKLSPLSKLPRAIVLLQRDPMLSNSFLKMQLLLVSKGLSPIPVNSATEAARYIAKAASVRQFCEDKKQAQKDDALLNTVACAPGVQFKTAAGLLAHGQLNTIQRVANADPVTLEAVGGLGKTAAKRLSDFFTSS